MILLDLEVKDQLSGKIAQFEKDAPKVELRILRGIASKYRSYVRKNYLSGQYLKRVTGQAWKLMKYKRAKGQKFIVVTPDMRIANIYHNPEGANIRPRTKTVLRWLNEAGEPQFARNVHIKPKPWMTDSFGAFGWDQTIESVGNDVVQKELAKRLNDGNS